MSITGFGAEGTSTLNGLITMDANTMNSDVIFYDATTTPVNVKTKIDSITVDITVAEADILVLQGQMVTANSNIGTLQGQVTTLDSEVNTAQSDIIALYSTTAASTAAIAGLSVSQAAQDVTIASHTVSIAALQLEDVSLDNRIDALEVKTTDQSWGSLSGTTFSTKTNVGATSAGVVLNTASASEFGSGILTSSVQPLTISSALAIGATQTSGAINIGNLSTRTGQINIGAATTVNAPIFIGSTVSTSQVVNINGANLTVGGVGTTNLAVQSAPSSNIVFGTDKTGGGIYFGMYNATASTNALFFNIGSLNTGSINFGTGASAKTITFGSAAATNNLIGTTTIAGITNINTTSFSNTNIGNGAAGGNFTVNAAANSITGTTNTLTSTGDIVTTSDQFLITTNTVAGLGIVHTSTTSNYDFEGKNSVSNSYEMRLSGTGTGGLTILGQDSGIQRLTANGAASTLQLYSDGDVELNATDLILTSTGTSGGGISLTANTYISMTSTTGDITTNSSANIINQIASVDKQTISSTTVTTNPTTTIDNQINGTAKQTITSTLITNTVPTVNSGLTYPISTTTALGYTTTTTSTTKFTTAAANLASLSIPAAGCYLVEGQWFFSGAVFTTQTFTTISLSTTSAAVNSQRQQTAYQGNVGGNYAGQVTSIFNFTGASTVYLVGLAQNALGATSNQQNFFSITRIA